MTLPRLPRWLKIIFVTYLAYLALVLLIATPLLNLLAPKIYREQTGAELKLEKIIWLNPFTLSITARQLSSVNADSSPFWSFDEFKADVALASLWRGHLVLDALSLHGLDVQIAQTAPARFNFSDILDYRAQQFPTEPAPTPTPAESKASKPFAIEINQLAFSAAHLGYRAPYAAEPVQVTIADFAFGLANFSTAPSPRGEHAELTIKALGVDFLREQHPFKTQLNNLAVNIPALATTANSAYEISLLDASGGSVQIKGSAALAQHSTTGSAQLRALNLVPAWQYLADKLSFTAERAQLDGDINFRLGWGEQFVYQIQNSKLALRDVQLQARADADTGAAFSALRAEGIAVDSTQPQIHIAQVALEQPVLRGWNRDTEVSLLDMIYFPTSAEQEESSPWQVRIDNIDVNDGTVHWRANQLDNRKLVIAPLMMHAANLHWPDPAPLQFNMTTAISSDTEHSAAVDKNRSVTADQNSTVAVDKNVAANNNNAIQLALAGELVPGDVTGKINGTIGNLPLTWGNTLVAQHMRARIAKGALSSQFAVTLDKAQPVLVHSEGAIEQFELQRESDKRKLAAWQKLTWRQLALDPKAQRIDIKQIALTQPWLQFRINADGTNNLQQLMVETEAASTDNRKKLREVAKSSQQQPALSPAENPWQFAIADIAIDRATIDFRDASLASTFRTNITELSGNITGLNSEGRKAAKVGLKGTVDGYAPVALTGSVNPFAATPALNVTLDMTNLDLAALTPYAGTYAGYQIDSGRLTLQLVYTLENNRIKGTNHIVVNQMQLGKQVSGPKVMDLPLRLAIYLLTDANGVMDLGVDVTGNVDDPDFSVGSIIWKAFRNLIVKTVASPFRALAGLIGGDREDLDRIEFQPGSSQLADGENSKLQAVNKALQQKPALKLNITAHVSPIRDLEALRDHALSAELIAQGGITPTDIQQQSKSWQREVVKLFKQRFPDENTEQWQVMQMNDAMRDNLELSPAALQELAAQRALAIKQTLVEELGLAADRAFVKPADLGADKDPGPYVTLAVE